MLVGEAYDVAVYGMRVLFLLALPVLIGVSFAGTLIAAFQAVTSLQDSATAFAVRVLALVLVLYFTMPSLARALMTLAERAWGV